MLRVLVLVAALACSTAVSSSAAAQFVASPQEVAATGTAYRVFVRPGEPIIRVQVLGDVGSGIYDIGAATTISELIALAGGVPLSDASPTVTRTVTVRLFREHAGRRDLVYEATVADMIQQPGRYPVLQDGDVITVETQVRQRFNWREATSIVSAVASLTLLVLRVIDRY